MLKNFNFFTGEEQLKWSHLNLLHLKLINWKNMVASREGSKETESGKTIQPFLAPSIGRKRRIDSVKHFSAYLFGSDSRN